MDKKSFSLLSGLFFAIGLLSLYACGSKQAGTFVGNIELEKISYEGGFSQSTEPYPNATVALTPYRTEAQFVFADDEHGPLKCKLDLTNRNVANDRLEVLEGQFTPGQACTIVDKTGQSIAVTVDNGEGGTFSTDGAYTTFTITLHAEGLQTKYTYKFTGNRK
jgi:hypothetical protein